MTKSVTVAAVFALLSAFLLPAAASARSAAAPVNTVAPAVTGTPKVGQTLTVSNGTWTGTPTSYSYRWQRCSTSSSCVSIAGATKQTYKLVNADAGRTVRAVVTATNADGSSTANSNQTSVVAASDGPVNTARPAIVGSAVVGDELTTTNGTWTGAPTSFTYQWLRCDTVGAACIAVPGATGKTYGVRAIDEGNTLRTDVTAHNANGTTVARSTPSDTVTSNPPVTVPGNKAPTLKFISLRRVGIRVYARFTVCDDSSSSVTVIERDSKTRALSATRRYSVTPTCTAVTRSWLPAPRFRTKGRYVVTLRAVDKSGASSGFVSRSLVRR
jgi:hypothetical protein